MKKDVIQINGRITINVNVSVKNMMFVKKIIFEILPHAIVKMEKASTMNDSAITCDEIIELHDEKTKAIPINFNE